MVKFKIVVSDPKSGKSKSIEVEGPKAAPFIGKKIGDTIDGVVIGMPGVKLLITGGSDKDGFPMRPDVHGGVKTRVLLSGGPGFKPKDKGERRRKTVRGNMITEDTMQINVKIIEKEEKT
ncbi:MAG: 30S ribosomal protein S6e [Candidatus Bathyarchaeia archaeon]|nr:30S ribosomal protein S6e [Candidatus Bathyarchaeota archaeon]